jgi:hypothetical protein
MSSPAQREAEERGLLEVIESLRHRYGVSGEWRGSALYERTTPEHPRRKPEWEDFIDLPYRSVHTVLNRLEAKGLIARARRNDGRVRADRVYLFPVKQEAA